MKRNYLFLSLLLLAAFPALYGQPGPTTFIAKNPEKIYLGAVMDSASLNQDTYTLLDVSVKPVTVSFLELPVKPQTFAPSYETMLTSVRDVLKNNEVKENYMFTATARILKSYDELHAVWGQKLNLPQWIGIPADYRTSKNILMVDITRTFFSLVMDQPDDGVLSTDPKFTEQEAACVYVNTLQFGRKVTVLLESAADQSVLIALGNKLLAGDTLTQTEQVIVANATLRVCAVGDELKDLDADNPFTSVLSYIQRKVTADDFGIPVSFTLAYAKFPAGSMFVNRIK